MNTQWQRYKDLELLPETTAAPQTLHSPLVAFLDRQWRSLLNHRAGKLDYEYQVEYLERRLRLTCDRPLCDRVSGRPTLLQKLWGLLNQPLGLGQSSLRSEPEIRRTLDKTGQAWWQVYDPWTGQTAFLESETEVQIWLEERLYQ